MADNIQKENMLKVGTMLFNGKYRVDQYLASGGFGNTYVATDTAFDEKVAIKELFIKGVCGRDARTSGISISLTENQRAFSAQQEKFRKEARRLRKLSNPHIVSVHDLFDENGTSYYVMDYVEGESLSARQKRTKKPMKESELMLILPQILDALECVHNEGIWHLDLKPANIMIDAKGNVQVIDFGASKQLKNANGDSLSTSSAMAYTPGYASSEQMEQKIEKFGPWTDLYSLGATLYNLLTMKQPPSPSDIDEDSRTALQLPAGVSKKTERLILWLMKPNRKMRPQSVADVKQYMVDGEEIVYSNAKDVDDDEGDTIVKGGKTSAGADTAEKKKTEDSSKGGVAKYVVIAAVAAVCIAGAFFGIRACGYSAEEAVEDTTAVAKPSKTFVEDFDVTISDGPDNMRKYKYTGDIENKLGALPNGKGKAKFDKYGDIPKSTYEGAFVNGVCEDMTGEAVMTFATGDKYIGTFKGGYYQDGKYILADGSYFEGTFKNGSPFNGKWYTADGSFDGDVVNGAEI